MFLHTLMYINNYFRESEGVMKWISEQNTYSFQKYSIKTNHPSIFYIQNNSHVT